MKKYFLILVTFILFFTCENVKADVLCKRAKNLHTETCTQTQNYCAARGYTNGATITYGTLGTNDKLATGDAFDCDINADGKYDAATERFYYVTDMDANTAVLIYYNNVSEGVADNSKSYAYNNQPTAFPGPTDAIKQLPSISQWKITLTTNIRDIKDEYKEVIVKDFKYTDRAARLLTYQEVDKVCNAKTTLGAISLKKECEFLMENTRYSNPSIATAGTWLENISSDNPEYAFHIYSSSGSVLAEKFYNGSYLGVRPAIEVSKNRMEISKVSNDNQTTENDNKTDSSNTTEIVKVEDTGINKLKVGISIGLAILVMGIMVIIQSTMKTKEKEEQ